MAIAFIKNPDERNDPPKPLMEHLLALRDMFVRSAMAWVIGVIISGCFANKILAVLMYPAKENRELFKMLDMTEGFDAWLSVTVWGGVVLAFPFIVQEILRFIFPALTRKEKFVILSGLSLSTFLFIGGAVLAYFKTLPMVVTAFLQISRWMGFDQDTIRIGSYIPIVIKLIIAFGLVFQVPLILFVLGCFGIVTSQGLRDKRRFAIVFSFVLAMFLTPPDPMSQIIMAVPLCLLYEVAIWAIWLKEKASFRRNRT